LQSIFPPEEGPHCPVWQDKLDDPPEHPVRGQNRPDQFDGMTNSAERTQSSVVMSHAAVGVEETPNEQSLSVEQVHVLVVLSQDWPEAQIDCEPGVHCGARAQPEGGGTSVLPRSASQICCAH